MGGYKKINLKLPLKLAELFDEYARGVGMSRAKLLRSWVLERTDTVYMVPQLGANDRRATFCFSMDRSTYQALQEATETYGVDMSTMLRILITSNMYNTRPELQDELIPEMNHTGEENSVESLWKSGHLSVLVEKLNEDIEQRNPAELMVLASASLRIGKVSLVRDALDLFESQARGLSTNHVLWGYFFLNRGKLYRIERKLRPAMTLFERAQKIGQIRKDRHLMGTTSYQQSVISWIHRDYKTAVDHALATVESLDAYNHGFELADAYIFMSKITMESDMHRALSFLHRAEAVRRVHDNDTMTAKVSNALGCYWGVDGDHKLAQEYLLKSYRYNSKHGAEMQMFYNLENLGKLAVAARKDVDAGDYFNKAIEIEQRIRPSKSVSIAKLMSVFTAASSSNLNKSYKRIDHLLGSVSHPRNQQLGYGIKDALRYIHGDGAADLDAGRQRLMHLRDSASSRQYADWLTEVLSYKRLPFFS